MKLRELLPTPTALRLVDFLLEHPHGTYMQGILVHKLDVTPATVRRALEHLAAVGVIHVHHPETGMKAVSLNLVDEPGRALLSLHKRLRKNRRTKPRWFSTDV